ncbi:MAG: hypothetical protein Q9164_006547 [Protoblastenia rupestris]
MDSMGRDQLSKFLARFEETQTAQYRLQTEQHRLQAEQLRLLRDLTKEAHTAGPVSKTPKDFEQLSPCDDRNDRKGNRNHDSLHGFPSHVQSAGENVKDGDSLRSSAPEAGIETPSPIQWSEEGRRARRAIAEAQTIDEKILLSVRDVFLRYRDLGYIFYPSVDVEYSPFIAGDTVKDRNRGLEWQRDRVDYDSWKRSLKESWPEFDKKAGRMRCVNARLDDDLVLWEFSHDKHGRLRPVMPSNYLSSAERSVSVGKPVDSMGGLRIWNGSLFTSPKWAPNSDESYISFHIRYFLTLFDDFEESIRVSGMKIHRESGRFPYPRKGLSRPLREMRASVILRTTIKEIPAVWTVVWMTDGTRLHSCPLDLMNKDRVMTSTCIAPLSGVLALIRTIDLILDDCVLNDWVVGGYDATSCGSQGPLQSWELVLQTLEDGLRVPVSYKILEG